MKIALAQLNYHIGNFNENNRKIIQHIRKAEEAGVDLIVFAELAVSGYPPRDFLEFTDFIEKCNDSVKEIASHCTGIAAIIGTPVFNQNQKGKPLYNAAAFLADGQVKHYTYKTLLPNYDIFDEYRYFEPNSVFETIEYKGVRFALNICEDLWNVQDNPLYTINPMDEVVMQQPEFIINIAASPFNYHQSDIRTDVLKRNARKYHLPLFYVNHVGAQTELLFDGGSLVMDKTGTILDEMKYFEEDFSVYDLNEVLKGEKKNGVTNTRSEIAMIHDALVMGVRNYFSKLGFKKAILGSSGGIDSAVTAALAAIALGPENVYNILMPSRFSSNHSVNDAVQLAENTGMPYEAITIERGFKAFEDMLEPLFKGLPFGIAEENLQARTRSV